MWYLAPPAAAALIAGVAWLIGANVTETLLVLLVISLALNALSAPTWSRRLYEMARTRLRRRQLREVAPDPPAPLHLNLRTERLESALQLTRQKALRLFSDAHLGFVSLRVQSEGVQPAVELEFLYESPAARATARFRNTPVLNSGGLGFQEEPRIAASDDGKTSPLGPIAAGPWDGNDDWLKQPRRCLELHRPYCVLNDEGRPRLYAGATYYADGAWMVIVSSPDLSDGDLGLYRVETDGTLNVLTGPAKPPDPEPPVPGFTPRLITEPED